MLRAVAEEKGELRSTVEVESPVLRTEIVGWDPGKWMQQLLDRAAETAAEPYVPRAEPDGRATAPEPTPEPAPEPEPVKHHSPVRFLS
jgi:hypothetical protein